MVFCKDFKVPLGKPKILEIFKKSSQNYQMIKFDQFPYVIRRIAVEMNNRKLEIVKEKMQDLA